MFQYSIFISLFLGLIPPADYVPVQYEQVIESTASADGQRVFPEVFDWRELGGVTPARDQGIVDCYPCWAFCLVAAVESSIAIESGRMVDLSEQQLLDCNQEGYGCGGGWLDGWTILRDFGAVTEVSYPYLGHNQLCSQGASEPVARVTECHVVGDDINAIKDAVMNHAPVACGMTVYNDFSFYSGGCYSHEGTNMYNHGVVIVGWDDTACDGNGAWIVKNSFGPNWGEDGYIYMEFGTCRIGAGARYFDVEVFPEELTYQLTLEDTELRTGDRFLLERSFYVPGPDDMVADEYVILMIQDLYYIIDASTGILFSAKQMNNRTVYDFIWPEMPWMGIDLILTGVLLGPDTFDVITMDSISASY